MKLFRAKASCSPSWRELAVIGLLFLALTARAATGSRFTIAVIPDTQCYCDATNAARPQPASSLIFRDQMQYLADQKSALNIVFATHVGDVVEHGDLYDQEWQYAANAMNVLAASGIPFGVAPGNHDYDNCSHPSNNRPLLGNLKWTQYFGPESKYFSGKSWYGGATNGGLDSWQTFPAGGKTFLHISLELEAGDEAIAWVSGVIAQHPEMPVMVTTHEYLGFRDGPDGKGTYLDDGSRKGLSYNNAAQVWRKLIAPNDRVFLVLCGHNFSGANNGVSNGENTRTDLNAAGHEVYQVLSDYQGNTAGADGKAGAYAGGAGWLRLMTFDPDAGTIHFQTYSTALKKFAGVPGGPAFNVAPEKSDFTLPIPARVFGTSGR